MTQITRAYAERGGVIGFTVDAPAPKGTLLIHSSEDGERLREVVGGSCRHAYDNKTMLVPGIPEAGQDNQAAYDAFCIFSDRVRKAMEG